MNAPTRSTDPRAASGGRLPGLVRSPWLRLGLLAVMIGLAAWLALSGDELTLTTVRGSIADLGAAGPLAYIGLYALVTVLLLPGTPFTILAGVLFGPLLGSVSALTGATLGATLAFLLGRVIGRGAVEQLAGQRIQGMDRFLAERGFTSVLLVRLVPLFPFNVLNLVSGVTGLRLRDYVVGTAIGIVPGTVLLVAVGGTIDDPTSPAFIAAVAGFAGLAVVGGLLARRLRRQERLDDVSADV